MDLIRFTACVAALMVSHGTAVAQQYPAKPVRIVAGFIAVKERLLAQGIESATGGVEEFASYLNLEIAKWAKVISAAAIPPQ